MHNRFVSFFWFGSNPKKYLSVCRALVFWLRIDIHLRKMGEKVLYYYLYHEEAPFYLGVYFQLFDRSFLSFNTSTIFIHLSLSSK